MMQQWTRGPEFAELATFAAVARDQSFRGAAKRLGVTPSSVSRSLGRLETRLGARLLNRTTRSVRLTGAGTLLLARLQPLFDGLDAAIEEVVNAGRDPAGLLRLNLPRIAADMLVLPLLPAFTQRHPEIRMDLVVDDGLSDVIADGFDAGIRVGAHLARDVVAVRIGSPLRNAIVTAPSYFECRPAPRRPRDLRDHDCLNYRWSSTGETYQWRFLVNGGEIAVDVEGTLTLNDTGLLRTAALSGLGLACLPERLVERDIAEGRLVRTLEQYCPPFPGFYLYHPSRTRSPPALRAFIDFLKAVDW